MSNVAFVIYVLQDDCAGQGTELLGRASVVPAIRGYDPLHGELGQYLHAEGYGPGAWSFKDFYLGIGQLSTAKEDIGVPIKVVHKQWPF
jgi:hypothetical protein